MNNILIPIILFYTNPYKNPTYLFKLEISSSSTRIFMFKVAILRVVICLNKKRIPGYDWKLHYNENTNNGDRGGGLQESNTTIRHRYMSLSLCHSRNRRPEEPCSFEILHIEIFPNIYKYVFLKVSIDSPRKVICNIIDLQY